MISYNDNIKNGELHITITKGIMHTFEFMNSLTEMSKKVLNSKSEKVFISAQKDDFQFDKLGIAYFYNLLKMFARNDKKVYIINWLVKLFNEKTENDGRKFEEIDIIEVIKREKLTLFQFRKETDVAEAVEKIVEFIQNSSMVLSKDFLITTIGEIFSNAFNHSEEDKLYFMYDIERKGENFYLIINVTDFGKTIVNNVKCYVGEKYNKDFTSNECIEWAIKDGNTTRDASGGHGLPTLIDYIKTINGELLIFSGDSLYALKGMKENIFESKGFFYGTSISLRIRLFDTSKIISYDKEQNKLISVSLDEL